MIYWVLFAVLPTLMGFYIVARLKFSESLISALAIGIPFGIVAFCSLLFAFDYVFGSVDAYAIALSLLVMLSASVLLYWFGDSQGLYSNGSIAKNLRDKKNVILKHYEIPKSSAFAAIVIFLIISAIFIAGIGYTSQGIYCIDAMCSDTLYHIGIGYSVAFGKFPPLYYFTEGTKNVFPFMSDFYMGMLHRFGLGIVDSLLLPDIMLIFSFSWLSMLIAYKISKSSRISIISNIMFWFGGVGFIKMLDFPFKNTLSGIFQPIHLFYLPGAHNTLPTLIYSVWKMSEIPTTYWTTIINSMLLAQRDLMLGLPIGLAIIYLLYSGFMSKNNFGAKEFLFIGILAGMLPLAHAETVVVVVFVGIFLLAYAVSQRDRLLKLRNFFLVFLPFLAIGVLEFIYMSSQRRQPGWSYFIYQSYIVHSGSLLTTAVFSSLYLVFYWIQIAGIPVVLGLLGLYFAGRKNRLFFVPFFALWVFVTVYTPQPDSADSNKIFLYVFLFLCIFMAYLVDALYKKGSLYKALGIILVALVVINFPLVFMHDVFAVKQPLLTNAEIDAAGFIVNNTPQNAVFAVNNYNAFRQTVSSIGMRQTLLSIGRYVGGIYKYEPSATLNATEQIINNTNCTAARQYNVTYVYLQDPAPSTLERFADAGFERIFNSTESSLQESVYIYKLDCS